MFLVSALLFVELNTEIVIYLILLFAAMMTGFLDDAAKKLLGANIKRVFFVLVGPN